MCIRDRHRYGEGPAARGPVLQPHHDEPYGDDGGSGEQHHDLGGQREGTGTERERENHDGGQRNRPHGHGPQHEHPAGGGGDGEREGGEHQPPVGGGERGPHLVAADGRATGAPVVEPGEPGRHQREPRKQPEQHDGHQYDQRTHAGLLGGVTGPALRPDGGLPHHQTADGAPGAGQRPTPERREPPGERQDTDHHGDHPREPDGTVPLLGVGRGPHAQRPERGGGDEEAPGRGVPPRPSGEGAGECADGGRDEEGRSHAGQVEVIPRQHPGDQGPPRARAGGDDPPHLGTPTPGVHGEILGDLVTDVVDDGSRGRVLDAHQPQHGPVGDTGRLEGAVVGECGAVGGDEVPQLGAFAHPVVEQPHDLGQQHADGLAGRQHQIDAPPLPDERDPAQHRRPLRHRPAQIPRGYHVFEPITEKKRSWRTSARAPNTDPSRSPDVRETTTPHTRHTPQRRSPPRRTPSPPAHQQSAAAAAPRTTRHPATAAAERPRTRAVGCRSPGQP